MSDLFIYLDSRYATDPSEPSIAVFNLNMLLNTYNHTHVQLADASFANLVYPINSSNQTLVVEENGASSTITLTITSQDYTGDEFATELQSILNAGTAEGTTYTVSFDSQTKKITISTDGNDFRITSASTCLFEIGLYTEMSSASTNFTMPYTVRLDGTEYVDIVSNLKVNNINASGRSTTLARVYLDSSYGSLVFWENETNDNLPFFGSDFSAIEMRLIDSKGNLYALPPNAPVSYTLKLSFQ